MGADWDYGLGAQGVGFYLSGAKGGRLIGGGGWTLSRMDGNSSLVLI